jgi:hypothetical protein
MRLGKNVVNDDSNKYVLSQSRYIGCMPKKAMCEGVVGVT